MSMRGPQRFDGEIWPTLFNGLFWPMERNRDDTVGEKSNNVCKKQPEPERLYGSLSLFSYLVFAAGANKGLEQTTT